MIWGNIQYDWPGAAVLLFAVPILLWASIFLYRYREQSLNNFADAAILNATLQPRLKTPFWIKTFLFSLIWICGVLALMQPKGNERYVIPPGEQSKKPLKGVVRQKAHDVIFLFDASASMSVADTRTGKSRLEESKEIADEIVSRLRGENVALQAFTTSTIQLVPSTTDYLFMRLMLRQVSINEGETEGTNLLQALETVRKIYFDIPSQKRKTLILLTDGGDTHLESLKGSDREQYMAKMLDTVKDADTQHLRVFAIGVGSKEGKEVPGIKYQGRPVVSALNETLLRKLSDIGNGQVYFDGDATAIQIASAIGQAIEQEPPFYEEKNVSRRIEGNKDDLLYDYYYKIPLGIALAALALFLLIPETLRREHPMINEI